MDESLITIIGFIIGGLSIFIYGINLMSDGLKSIAGYHIREYIEKYTSNLFTSILVGTLISAILHSFCCYSYFNQSGSGRINEVGTGYRNHDWSEYWDLCDFNNDRLECGTICLLSCLYWGCNYVFMIKTE